MTRSLLRLAAPFALVGLLASASPGRAPGIHVVQLTGNRFMPSVVKAAPGDTIRFVNGLGGPHNVQFMAESISVSARAALDDAMEDRILALTSPMFITEGESYTLVVPKLEKGRYPFLCSPHWANMRGALVVE